jgi:hypothetical protein
LSLEIRLDPETKSFLFNGAQTNGGQKQKNGSFEQVRAAPPRYIAVQ